MRERGGRRQWDRRDRKAALSAISKPRVRLRGAHDSCMIHGVNMPLYSRDGMPCVGCWLTWKADVPSVAVWRLRPKPRVSAALRVGDNKVQKFSASCTLKSQLRIGRSRPYIAQRVSSEIYGQNGFKWDVSLVTYPALCHDFEARCCECGSTVHSRSLQLQYGAGPPPQNCAQFAYVSNDLSR